MHFNSNSTQFRFFFFSFVLTQQLKLQQQLHEIKYMFIYTRTYVGKYVKVFRFQAVTIFLEQSLIHLVINSTK